MNDVKEVKVSESSRRDARRGGTTKNEVEVAVEDLKRERDAVVSRIVDIQDRLTVINGLFRDTLPKDRYERLLSEQLDLKSELGEKQKLAVDFKRRVHRLNQDLPDRRKTHARDEYMMETNRLLVQILAELKKLNEKP